MQKKNGSEHVIFQFVNGDDVLLDQVENEMPSLDIPTLKKPRTGALVGPVDQYNRIRYLDMATLSHNMVLTKKRLEDANNTWSKDGIPLAWRVSTVYLSVYDAEV